ncbi:hypothetical protein EVAR_16806_1 [Eumeta japonica]|uniref:Uncharacterized protein n=1 Tax=Eumeta variegata TaxID=151549 RepID=A0A4C1UL38_EUMVA|nr:hypothetical protein EVAR_16806_1 [Eumeta japonica]
MELTSVSTVRLGLLGKMEPGLELKAKPTLESRVFQSISEHFRVFPNNTEIGNKRRTRIRIEIRIETHIETKTGSRTQVENRIGKSVIGMPKIKYEIVLYISTQTKTQTDSFFINEYMGIGY